MAEKLLLNSEVKAIIEAVLFAAGHPVTYEKLGQIFEVSPSVMKNAIYEYEKEYNSPEAIRGILLLPFDDCCQLSTKEDYTREIRICLGIRRGGNLSASSVEVLAIVAYNQPVTRAYIDTVRGVDSSYAVSSLVERGLIESQSRLDAPGRPMLYTTTTAFLRCFGLEKLSDLPDMKTARVDMFASLKEEGTDAVKQTSYHVKSELIETIDEAN